MFSVEFDTALVQASECDDAWKRGQKRRGLARAGRTGAQGEEGKGFFTGHQCAESFR